MVPKTIYIYLGSNGYTEIIKPCGAVQLSLGPKSCACSGASGFSSVIQILNIRLPLLDVRPKDSTIIRQEPIDLAFNIGSLCPCSTIARKHPGYNHSEGGVVRASISPRRI
jgi:hypothetical protein